MKNADEINANEKNPQNDETGSKQEEEKELDFDPDSKNQCLLIINAAVFDVNLHICDNRIRILYNDEHTELNALSDKWYSLPQLIQVMRSSGINVFPREDSMKYVQTTEKV